MESPPSTSTGRTGRTTRASRCGRPSATFRSATSHCTSTTSCPSRRSVPLTPVPAFAILDPSKDWTVITSPIEQRTIALNASKPTDDHDKLAALNFTWTIPGPIVGLETGVANHTKYGVNVSFAWQEWNNSYAVLLSVKDTGFRGNDPGKPNTGNLTRKINVQID